MTPKHTDKHKNNDGETNYQENKTIISGYILYLNSGAFKEDYFLMMKHYDIYCPIFY